MRVAFVAPGYPYRGGISHFATRLAQQLSIDHECLYLNFKRLYPDLLFPGKTQLDHSESTLSFPSERRIDSIYPLSWIRAGKKLTQWNADAVIFHWWQPFFGPSYRGIMSGTRKQIVYISICHNVAPHEKGRLWNRAVKFGLGKMDGFVVHAKREAHELRKLIPKSKQITLFHPVYDIFPNQDLPKKEARASLGLRDDDRVVLYFGIIRSYKGVEVLLRAASHLKDIPRLKILVVGEIYSDRVRIERLINKLPEGIVRLVNSYIPNEEVSTWFRACDLVALPYLSATQSGIIPIAYCCDRPVVVTNIGGLPEVVKEGISGYLVEPNNAKELAVAIRKHLIKLNNPDMSEGIGLMRQKLSWSRYAGELANFIKKLKG